jgi:hypothetical protein
VARSGVHRRIRDGADPLDHVLEHFDVIVDVIVVGAPHCRYRALE